MGIEAGGSKPLQPRFEVPNSAQSGASIPAGSRQVTTPPVRLASAVGAAGMGQMFSGTIGSAAIRAAAPDAVPFTPTADTISTILSGVTDKNIQDYSYSLGLSVDQIKGLKQAFEKADLLTLTTAADLNKYIRGLGDANVSQAYDLLIKNASSRPEYMLGGKPVSMGEVVGVYNSRLMSYALDKMTNKDEIMAPVYTAIKEEMKRLFKEWFTPAQGAALPKDVQALIDKLRTVFGNAADLNALAENMIKSGNFTTQMTFLNSKKTQFTEEEFQFLVSRVAALADSAKGCRGVQTAMWTAEQAVYRDTNYTTLFDKTIGADPDMKALYDFRMKFREAEIKGTAKDIMSARFFEPSAKKEDVVAALGPILGMTADGLKEQEADTKMNLSFKFGISSAEVDTLQADVEEITKTEGYMCALDQQKYIQEQMKAVPKYTTLFNKIKGNSEPKPDLGGRSLIQQAATMLVGARRSAEKRLRESDPIFQKSDEDLNKEWKDQFIAKMTEALSKPEVKAQFDYIAFIQGTSFKTLENFFFASGSYDIDLKLINTKLNALKAQGKILTEGQKGYLFGGIGEDGKKVAGEIDYVMQEVEDTPSVSSRSAALQKYVDGSKVFTEELDKVKTGTYGTQIHEICKNLMVVSTYALEKSLKGAAAPATPPAAGAPKRESL